MGKERRKVIFDEKDDGMVIRIPHREMMCEDTTGFILTILHGRTIYQRNHHADMDVNDTEEE